MAAGEDRAGGEKARAFPARAGGERKARMGARLDAACGEAGVASVRARFDGFTARKRRRFIAILARTGCWSDAARVAGISRETARRWRGKDARFASLCAAAIDRASSHIETLAWERGVTGIEEPVIHHGKQVGVRIKRSDSIFRMLLIASNKEKYGRMGAVGRKAVERKLRPQIEKEVRGSLRASDEEVTQALVKQLSAFGVRVAAEEEGEGEG